MISLKIRFYGMYPNEQLKAKLNSNKELTMDFNNEITIKKLLDELQVDPTGKLVSINGKVIIDHSAVLKNEDKVEIRMLYAGG